MKISGCFYPNQNIVQRGVGYWSLMKIKLVFLPASHMFNGETEGFRGIESPSKMAYAKPLPSEILFELFWCAILVEIPMLRLSMMHVVHEFSGALESFADHRLWTTGFFILCDILAGTLLEYVWVWHFFWHLSCKYFWHNILIFALASHLVYYFHITYMLIYCLTYDILFGSDIPNLAFDLA